MPTSLGASAFRIHIIKAGVSASDEPVHRAELDRVVQQVPHHLLQPSAVAVDDQRQPISRQLERHTLGMNALQGCTDILRFGLELAGTNARDIQKNTDDARLASDRFA